MDKVQVIIFAANFIAIFKNIVVYAIIARILASWFTMGQGRPSNRLIIFLHDITDPFINLARKIPHQIGMFDLAPMIALFGIDLLGQLLVRLLYSFV